jgi:hypothetical protein
MTDALQIKEKIISTINEKGPTLPIQIAKETGLSILFSSAFLSELYNEKKIKMSHLRVGSSPVYYLQGQESQLEKFAGYLKNKEKEAFEILKENKFLEDSKLHPAIRVALREIKDFAIPFKKDEEVCWKFFTISNEEITDLIEEPKKREEKENKNDETKKELDIFDKKEEPQKKKEIKEKKLQKKTPVTKKTNKKKDENFFNKIKEFLSEREIEIIDIVNFKNDEAKIKIKENNKEEFLFAFNRKKITEKEILKASKESGENQKYRILSFGEPLKKVSDFINAAKNLSKIEKIDEKKPLNN